MLYLDSTGTVRAPQHDATPVYKAFFATEDCTGQAYYPSSEGGKKYNLDRVPGVQSGYYDGGAVQLLNPRWRGSYVEDANMNDVPSCSPATDYDASQQFVPLTPGDGPAPFTIR